MPPQIRTGQILDSSVNRNDLDSVTAGVAVIKRIIAGRDVVLTSTGVDAGTGDVIINNATRYKPVLGSILTNSFGAIAPVASSNLTPGIVRVMPIEVYETTNFDQLIMDVVTGIAGNIRFGLYNSDASGNWPGAFNSLVDSGVVSTATAGSKVFALSPVLTLTPGIYWVATQRSATISMRSQISAASKIVSVSSLAGFAHFNCLQVNQSFGSFPPTFPTIASGTASGFNITPYPLVGLRVSA